MADEFAIRTAALNAALASLPVDATTDDVVRRAEVFAAFLRQREPLDLSAPAVAGESA